MSYEDLEDARARRAAVGKKDKEKRVPQAVEADVMETGPLSLQPPEFGAPVARMV